MSNFRILLTSSLSSSLEFYDFAIYMSFFPLLSQLFFPHESAYHQWLSTFAVFAVGYLARPIGGIIFSHLGDTKGRKNTFMKTILGITATTFLIALLPTYQQINSFAPLLLVLLRILQGLSFGGEVPGALVYVSEIYPKQHHAFYFSLIFVFLNLGNFLAMGLAYILYHILSESALLQWGWRIPFILGGVLGMIVYYLRFKISESPVFQEIVKRKQLHKIPFLDIFSQQGFCLLQGIAMSALGAVIVILLNIYMPGYLKSTFFYSEAVMSKIHWMNTITLCVAVLGFGILADRIGWKKLLNIGCFLLLILGYPSYFLFSLNPEAGMIACLILTLLGAMIISCYTAILIDLFEAPLRYTGVSLSFNLGFALFGGTAPLIATTLIHYTHNALSPVFYIIFCTLSCFLFLFCFRRAN